jgi:hypothetical protein
MTLIQDLTTETETTETTPYPSPTVPSTPTVPNPTLPDTNTDTDTDTTEMVLTTPGQWIVLGLEGYVDDDLGLAEAAAVEVWRVFGGYNIVEERADLGRP